MSQRVRTTIALVITFMWAVGIVADGVSTNYEQPLVIHAIMLGLASAIFGANFVKGARG